MPSAIFDRQAAALSAENRYVFLGGGKPGSRGGGMLIIKYNSEPTSPRAFGGQILRQHHNVAVRRTAGAVSQSTLHFRAKDRALVGGRCNLDKVDGNNGGGGLEHWETLVASVPTGHCAEYSRCIHVQPGSTACTYSENAGVVSTTLFWAGRSVGAVVARC